MMKIKTFEPYKTKELTKGDLIFGEEEFNNGHYTNSERTTIKVDYLNEKDCDVFEEKMETMFSKGKVFQFPRKISLKCIDETREKSIWAIVDVFKLKDFHGLHGIVPDMKRITAMKVVDNQYDKNSERIEFNMIGENAIDKEFEIIGQIKKTD